MPSRGSSAVAVAATRQGEGTRSITQGWPEKYTAAHETDCGGQGCQAPPSWGPSGVPQERGPRWHQGRDDPGLPHWTCSLTGTQKGRQGSGQLLARALGQSVLRYRRMHTHAPGKRHQRGVRRGTGAEPAPMGVLLASPAPVTCEGCPSVLPIALLHTMLQLPLPPSPTPPQPHHLATHALGFLRV